MFYIDIFQHDHQACVLLYCTKKDRLDECFATAPAAEGSTCGDGKVRRVIFLFDLIIFLIFCSFFFFF